VSAKTKHTIARFTSFSAMKLNNGKEMVKSYLGESKSYESIENAGMDTYG